MSIALEVCRMAEERLGRDALRRLVRVGVDVGDDAGVEISSLEFCLESALAGPPFAGAKPAITRHPGNALRLSYLEVEDDDGPHD
ncbi:MAG TPA: hypothetical protein VF978_01160 [Gemmatimonadales bacterium]